MAKILVVDDSRLSRRILCGPLREAGHDTIEAKNGQHGLEAFHDKNPDLVLSDLLMPVMDGFGMVSAIRGVDEATPIVVCSADIQASSRVRCDSLGVDRLIHKPVNPSELVAAIEEALAAREVCGG